MKRLWFILTHSFKIVKIGCRWVVCIKEKGKWFTVQRFLSKKNAEDFVKEIKKRGFV